jgi:hypothetical protein
MTPKTMRCSRVAELGLGGSTRFSTHTNQRKNNAMVFDFPKSS